MYSYKFFSSDFRRVWPFKTFPPFTHIATHHPLPYISHPSGRNDSGREQEQENARLVWNVNYFALSARPPKGDHPLTLFFSLSVSPSVTWVCNATHPLRATSGSRASLGHPAFMA